MEPIVLREPANGSHSDIVATCNNLTITADKAIYALCQTYLRHHHDINSPLPTSTFGHHRPTAPLVWGFGLFFVTLISLCALVGIAIMRLLKKSTFNRFITFFVSVGVGSLSGSAVFHLLPQAFGLVSEFDPNASHEYLYKAFAAVVGIYLFFFADKAIKIILEIRKRRKTEIELHPLSNGKHSTNNYEIVHDVNSGRSSDALLAKNGKPKPHHCDRHPTIEEDSDADKCIHRQAHSICVHDHDVEYKQGDSVIATVAWMIIFGDGLHNLIDGISIGAAFSESLLSGISVSVAVLCEEFPHELGDVAILVSAGMTLRQALVYNLLSALSCYIGFFIGVFVGNIDDSFASYTFGFAGGMFLYISLSCMMPEMKNAMEEALNLSLKHSLEVLFLQASGMFCGLGLMICMARFGGEISFE
ncbi:Zrt (ZRT), Irt-(IRT-) like Protein Transporter [Aphelenchoides bicaudatus]|nr:Zrt (ZRT), Irt-(IRT-) like Protein Transporter [Aphelenchoides bicaudatus]